MILLIYYYYPYLYHYYYYYYKKANNGVGSLEVPPSLSLSLHLISIIRILLRIFFLYTVKKNKGIIGIKRV